MPGAKFAVAPTRRRKERRRMKQMGCPNTEFRFFVRPVRATEMIRDA
jgi:hypothetical protein